MNVLWFSKIVTNTILQTVCAAASVIEEIWTDYFVAGVTSVDAELFVLLWRDDDYEEDNDINQVAVYSINDYQLLRHLDVPGYTPDNASHMTSCVRHKCLYVSDGDNSCIHRYQLASSATSKWTVSGKPLGLSITPSGNLLVTCEGEPDKLIELRADSGQHVREVELPSAIVFPWHSVQVPSGQYVLCHGVYERGLHRVCAVGDDGQVTRSYGGQRGSDVGRLHIPCHLAVDEDSQFVFVADMWNHRVVLLTPTLQFVRYVIEQRAHARRQYFHQSTRRLFVGGEGGVTVIQL